MEPLTEPVILPTAYHHSPAMHGLSYADCLPQESASLIERERKSGTWKVCNMEVPGMSFRFTGQGSSFHEWFRDYIQELWLVFSFFSYLLHNDSNTEVGGMNIKSSQQIPKHCTNSGFSGMNYILLPAIRPTVNSYPGYQT